jgi:tetratricopeptide (TPR) repeat protein
MKIIFRGIVACITIALSMGLSGQVARSTDQTSLVNLVKQYTVRIRTNSVAPGSGFIVARQGNRYTVVTAAHVLVAKPNVPGATVKCAVLKMYDGEVYQAVASSIRILGRNDLAVFEFDSPKDYPIAKFSSYEYALYADRNYQASDAGTPELVGQQQRNRNKFSMFAVGYPNISKPDNDVTCSSDIKDQSIWSKHDRLVVNPGFLIDNSGTSISNPEARINNYELIYSNFTAAGMSGGPIVDPNGRVIGMHGRADGKELEGMGAVVKEYLEEVTAKISEDTVDGIPPERLNFGFSAGVPTHAIVRLANRLKLDTKQLNISNAPPNTPTVSLTSWKPENNFKVNGKPQTDNALYWLQEGNQHWRLGNLDQAQRSFDQALAIDAQKKNGIQHFGHFLKGFVYAKSHNYQQALESCNQATNTPQGRDYYDAWRCKAASHAYLGQYSQAVAALNKAIQIQGNKGEDATKQNPSDYEVLAELLWQQQQYNGALVAIRTAVKIRAAQDLGDSALLFNLQARILLSLQQYDAALNSCESALKANSSYATAFSTKGLILQAQGKLDLAESAFRRATELDAQDADAWNNLGFALYERASYESALAAFEKAVQLDPKNPAARQNRDDLRQQLKP